MDSFASVTLQRQLTSHDGPDVAALGDVAFLPETKLYHQKIDNAASVLYGEVSIKRRSVGERETWQRRNDDMVW